MGITKNMERWKSFLITCPDEVFFEIMRSSLGDIQTPFNKHSLIKKLTAYLQKHDTKNRMLSLVTEKDAFLLSVIFVLNEPDLGRLYSFTKDEYRYLELHSHLLNLEERMLIYRSDEDPTMRLRFNPVLYDELLDRVINTDLVFVSFDFAGETWEPTNRPPSPTENATWLSDLLILAILAYLRENPSPLKASGTPKKGTENDLTKRFSSLGPNTVVVQRFCLIVDGLTELGLVKDSDGGFAISAGYLKAFASLDRLERTALVAGALWRKACGFTSMSAAEGAAAVLFLSEHTAAGRGYTIQTIKRYLHAMGIRQFDDEDAEALLEVLTALGIAEYRDPGYGFGEPGFLHPSHGDGSSAVVQPNFEVTLKPWVSFKAAVEVALMAEIRSYDFFPVFELTRDAVTRRLADGVASAAMISTLEELNDGIPSSNVIFSLESWEKEYRSVRLFYGTVLLIDPDRQHLVEHSAAMSDLFASSPAPGIYLLNTNDADQIEKALKGSGMDQTPAIENKTGSEPSDSSGPDISILKPPLALNTIASDQQVEQNVVGELHNKLDSMRLKPEQKKDLADLIEKGLILYPNQLEHLASSPKEKNEARGFDYVGKVRLIERTLLRDDLLLEVINRDSTGSSDTFLVKPVELRKTGSNLDLHCKELPEQRELTLRVRSMSLVRIVRGSQFVL